MRRDDFNIEVTANTRGFEDALDELKSATRDFGRIFSSTISSAIRSGKGFDDFLRSLGQRISNLALSRALKPLEKLFDDLLGSIMDGVSGRNGQGFGGSNAGSLAGNFASNFLGQMLSGSNGIGITPFAKGGVVPFAQGGVVSSPTLFNFGNRTGLMGEAGAEAILPLGRGSDGRLGVMANSASGGVSPVNIVFNVQAADAPSFRKSEGQISTMLARVVGRGQRGL